MEIIKNEFDCFICKKHIIHENSFTVGYAVDHFDNKICYNCCGYEDKATMILEGKIVLYLSKSDKKEKIIGCSERDIWEITNWPGTLRFKCYGPPKKSWHNIARNRYDVWFPGPDGFDWHGIQYGENNQLCRCKRTKNKIQKGKNYA